MQIFTKMTLLFLLIHFLAAASEVEVPKDLLHKGKPLPNYYFFWFANHPETIDLSGELEEVGPGQDRITFEWDYLGSYHGKYHLLKTYYWETGAMGKFTQLLLIKREGDLLVVTDVIYGGDRHASSIFCASQEGDRVVYTQGVTSGGILEIALELFPEIEPLYKRSSKKGLCYGEGCFWGSNTYVATVTPEGKFHNHLLLYYRTPEGESPPDKKYSKDEFKAVALDMLYDIDRDKPEELKQDGIAFSPSCFRKILEDDLKEIEMSPRFFNLVSDQSESSSWSSSFSWDYIGKINKHFLINASINEIEKHFFGIYAIAREKNVLKKVARIFHEKDNRYSHPFDLKVEGESLTYWKKVTCKNLFQLFCEKFPLLSSKADKKKWSTDNESLDGGLVKMRLQISADGRLRENVFIGFMSSADPLREERELVMQKKSLVPMDKALLFTGVEMPNPYEFDREINEEQLMEFFQRALKRATQL